MTRNTKLVVGLIALVPLAANATNGYFQHGASIKTQGMAGVRQAVSVDSIQAASNPAAVTRLGDQVDAGLSYFKPDRSSSISGNGAGLNGRYDGNSDSEFFIPQLGFTRAFDDKLSYGLALYGNGGMNTSYATTPFQAFGSSGPGGVDLAQLFTTASLGYKLSQKQSIGLGLTHVYQKFSAEGIQSFGVINPGYDHSTGFGLSLGWQGEITDQLTLGARWSSRIDMDEFNKYRGLFAEQGDFDIPESYALGFALELNPQWTLMGDYERINYSEVASVGNRLTDPSLLGQDQGPGFGWRDINVYKLGVSYLANNNLTVRAGISHADQPIPTDQTFLNILAPGVVQDHISLGATWDVNPSHSVSFAYTKALKEQVKGKGSIPTGFGGGEADIQMDQDIFGIAWHYKF